MGLVVSLLDQFRTSLKAPTLFASTEGTIGRCRVINKWQLGDARVRFREAIQVPQFPRGFRPQQCPRSIHQWLCHSRNSKQLVKLATVILMQVAIKIKKLTQNIDMTSNVSNTWPF